MPSFVLLFVGCLFMMIGLVVTISKSPKVNKVLGYRTRRAMLSEETWESGNKRFARNIGVSGIIDSIVGGLSLNVNNISVAVINFLLFSVGLGLSILLTEKYLAKKYNC